MEISGTVTAQTGFPVTGFINGSIASRLSAMAASPAPRSPPAPATASPTQIATRNSYKGPGVHNTDARLSRQFPLFHEGMTA